MKITPLLVTGLIFLGELRPVLADNSSQVIINNGSTDTHVSIQNTVNGESTSVKIDNDAFTIEGVVTSVNSPNFSVNGQTIYSDPAKVQGFALNGTIDNGKKVKVDGVIIDGKMYAKTITVDGTGGSNYKIAVNYQTTTAPVASPKPSPTATPAPNSSPESQNPASSPGPTPTLNTNPDSLPDSSQITITISKTVNQINDLFNRVFAFFNNLKI